MLKTYFNYWKQYNIYQYVITDMKKFNIQQDIEEKQYMSLKKHILKYNIIK